MNQRKSVMATFPLLLAAMAAAVPAATVPATLDIDVNKPGVAIPPTFYGFMTEEINHSYDGGVLAELVQNRTFQDPLPPHRGKPVESPPPADPPIHWAVVGDGTMATDRSDPVTPALPISLRLDLAGGKAGLANDGYWGVPVRPDTKYTASFYAKGGGGFAGPVTASIVTDDGDQTVATADTTPVTDKWVKYTVTLTTGHDAPTTAKARFVVGATGTGSVTFSLVSLFPPTYMDTPNGLRPDLMKLMADLHPAFIRLPGGNYLEGDYFSSRFNWKHEIGPVEDRPGHMGCWNYRSSGGFGLPQYLLWCKQLNAEPVLAVFAGYVLQHDHADPGSPQMAQYTQEALEEIEYVSGPADSEWGKRRAADGFAEPFKLHYVEIGNEDWFDRSGSYDGRFTEIATAIRAKYPELKLIATAPVKSSKPDLYDDHYYRSAAQMAGDSDHYDAGHKGRESYNSGRHAGAIDRNGPQIFVGEWATREGRVTSSLNAALADAAWLMGLERNADLIPIQCYAPLLVNVNRGAWQWRIDLIGYDAMSAFGSASYYAQAMFAQNKGDVVLPAKVSVAPTLAAAEPAPHGAVGVGAFHTAAEFKDITVTAPDGRVLLKTDLTKDTPANPAGWTFTGDKWSIVQGALKPSALDSETWGMVGDPSWTDYTLRLKARKTAGNEGFLILFHVSDGDNYARWNVGGRRNTRAQVEAEHDWTLTPLGQPANFTVETGKWYDLRLEVAGHHVKCYADDQLISEATDQAEQVRTPLLASACYAKAAGDVIVKVVNLGSDTVDATINLRGAGAVKANGGKAIVLAGHPLDENTIDQPTLVAPKEEPLTDAAASFHRAFPPHSLTLLRVPATPQQ
jgi:alpha-L-arabinofuranosidase